MLKSLRSFSEASFEREVPSGAFQVKRRLVGGQKRRDGGEVQERTNRFLIETTDLIEPKTPRPTEEKGRRGEEASHTFPRFLEDKTLKCTQTMRADERS